MKTLSRLAAASLMLALVACGDDDGTGPATVATVSVTSATGESSLLLGETLQLTAAARDADGNAVNVSGFAWSTSDASVASVSSNGVVTAEGGGTATISASAGGRTGTFTVTVGGSLHNQNITQSQTWRAVDGPHLVDGQLEVGGASGPVLTIEAGSVVRFTDGSGLWFGSFSGPGALRAEGTASAPITMRADAALPAAGDWEGLLFLRNAGPSDLEHVTLSHCGGGGAEPACIWVEGVVGEDPDLLLDHVTIQNSGGYGVFARGEAGFRAGGSALTVTGSQDAPVRITPNEAGTIPTGGSFTANGTQAVELGAGRVTRSQTWPQLGVPYLVTSDIVVEGTAAPVLTLPPGSELRFDDGTGLGIGTCGAGGPGTLIAEGTAAQPIVLTSSSASPAPGDWGYLSFECTAGSNSRLRHAVVEYGGGVSPYAAFAGNIIVEQEMGAVVTNTAIRFSEDCGIIRRSPLVTWTTDSRPRASGTPSRGTPAISAAPEAGRQGGGDHVSAPPPAGIGRPVVPPARMSPRAPRAR